MEFIDWIRKLRVSVPPFFARKILGSVLNRSQLIVDAKPV